jgi:shikimate kinase
VVYLRVSFGQAITRTGADPGRPMLHRPGLDGLYRDRLGLYASVAHVVLDTDGRSADTIVDQVLEKVSE